MFRMMISGRTMAELKAKIQECLNGMNDSTEASEPSQAPVEFSDPALLRTTPHIPEQEFAPQSPTLTGDQVFAPPPRMEIPEIPFNRPAEVTVPAPVRSIPTTPNPVQSAAPPPSAPTVSPANEYGLDSKGLPWDARIHAVTQGVNKDGSWRNRRGVEPAMLAQIEAELRARKPAPVPGSPLSPFGPPPPVMASFQPPVPSAPAPATHGLTMVPPLQPPTSVAPPPMPTPPQPALLSAHTVDTFRANLVPTLAKLVQDGKLTHEYVQQLKTYFQVDQIWEVSGEQLTEMFENFVAAGLLVKV